MKVSILSPYFKVYNGMHSILRELGRIACDILLRFGSYRMFCIFFEGSNHSTSERVSHQKRAHV